MHSPRILLTQGKYALVDVEDYDYLNQWKWYYANGYAIRSTGYGVKSIRMHRLILNAPEGLEVDHINGDGIDNRRINLRLATRNQNQRNKRIQKNNQSGFKGVCRNSRSNTYRAYIGGLYLGSYSTAEEAAQVYNDMAVNKYEEFARLNNV